jgi:hypothetical protein
VTILVTVLFSVIATSTDITVGVKQGDWIEYNVECTGTVPEEHDVTWAKMEFLKVNGLKVDVNITSLFVDGNQTSVVSTLDLETGETGDGFLVPANLSVGNNFTDYNYGNVTIIEEENKTYVYAKRNTVYAVTPNTKFHWDKTTGILVEAHATYSNFTMDTKVKDTNMWQPDPTEIDPRVSIMIVTAIIVFVTVLVVIKNKR